MGGFEGAVGGAAVRRERSLAETSSSRAVLEGVLSRKSVRKEGVG